MIERRAHVLCLWLIAIGFLVSLFCSPGFVQQASAQTIYANNALNTSTTDGQWIVYHWYPGPYSTHVAHWYANSANCPGPERFAANAGSWNPVGYGFVSNYYSPQEPNLNREDGYNYLTGAEGNSAGCTYTLYYYGWNGGNWVLGSNTTVNVLAPSPTVDIWVSPATRIFKDGADPLYGWSTSNADYCDFYIDGAWAGNGPVNGVNQWWPIQNPGGWGDSPNRDRTYTIWCKKTSWNVAAQSWQDVWATDSATLRLLPALNIDSVSSGPTCGLVSGWAFDSNQYGTSRNIHLYKDGPAGSGDGHDAGILSNGTGANSSGDVDAAMQSWYGLTGSNGLHRFSIQHPRPGGAGTHTMYTYALGVNGNTLRTNTYTCDAPAPPTGLGGSCVANGNQARVTTNWNASAGATQYAIRADLAPNSWFGAGDILNDNVPTSYGWDAPYGSTYRVWVHAINAYGWSANPETTITCPPNPPPAVTLTPNTSEGINLGQSVTYTLSATDASSDMTNLNFDHRGPNGLWDWQPGGGEGWVTVPDQAFSARGSYSYSTIFTPTSAGTYTVYAAALDPSGWAYSSPFRTITVCGTGYFWNGSSCQINTYTVNASAGAGGSIVAPLSRSISHGGGTAFTINANTGYTITSVSLSNGNASASGCSAGQTSCTYTLTNVTGPVDVTAAFTINQYTLTLNNGGGSISGTCTGTCSLNHGTAVSLTAGTRAGYTFTNWTASGAAAACNGTAGVCSFSMTSAGSVTANYVATPPVASLTASTRIAAGATGVLSTYAGETPTISWSGTNSPTTCSVYRNGALYGTYAYPGTASLVVPGTSAISPATTDSYHVTCTNPGGTSGNSNTIRFYIPPPPTAPAVSCHPAGTSATMNWALPTLGAPYNAGDQNLNYFRAYQTPPGWVCNNTTDVCINGTGNTYTWSPITAGNPVSWWVHTRVADGNWSNAIGSGFTCTPVSYALDVSKGGTGAGTVSSNPAGIDCGTTCSASYSYGTVVQLTANPAAGSFFSGWSGGGCSGTGSCVVTMTAAQSVTATFTINTYTVNATAGAGGTISPASRSVTHNGNTTFTVTPSAGYTLSSVTYSGGGSGSGCSAGQATPCTYTLSGVTSGGTVTATFTINTYNITASAGAGCSIAPSGVVSVNHGSNQAFTITPSAGYGISSVVVDGVSQGAIGSYTFSNVTTGHTIAANCVATPPVVSLTANTARATGATGVLSTYYGETPTIIWSGTNSPTTCSVYRNGALYGTYAYPGTASLVVPGTSAIAGSADSYHVTCTNPGGTSGNSNTITFNVPNIPTLNAVSCNAAGTQATLSWTYPSPNPVPPGPGGGYTQAYVRATTPPTGVDYAAACTPPRTEPSGVCLDMYAGTSRVMSVTPSAAYSWFMHTAHSNGNWSNAVFGGNFTCTPVSYAATVVKAGTGAGTVTSNPAGISCGADCTENYSYGTLVQLTASPAPGSVFSGWSGGGCSGTGSCVVTMTAAQNVTATFNVSTYDLTVTKVLNGGSVGTVTSAPAGISCGADCTETYGAGVNVVLTASAGANSVFAGWSGEGCSGTGTCTVSMTQARTVTATFHSITTADIFCNGASSCNITYGSTASITWLVQGSIPLSACTINGEAPAWNLGTEVSPKNTTALFMDTTYSLSCYGTLQRSANVIVDLTPELWLENDSSKKRTTVNQGGTATLNWDTKNQDCSLTGLTEEIGPSNLDQARYSSTNSAEIPIGGMTTYILSCPGGQDSVTIEIVPARYES